MSSAPSGQCQAKCIAYAVGLVAGGALIGYIVGRKLESRRVNHKIKLGCSKVADVIDVEDIGEKKSYCRCWKSEKFPLCDGSHNAHNKATGDNVGPLNIRGKPAAAQ